MPQKCVSGRDSEPPDPAGGAYSAPADLLPEFEGPLRLLTFINVPVCFNLVLLIYLSYGPSKSLKSP